MLCFDSAFGLGFFLSSFGWVFFSFCTVTQKIQLKFFNKNLSQICHEGILP